MAGAEADAVRDYHERTKHRLNRYASSLGYLDWANQPSPFRRFEGSPLHKLLIPGDEAGPSYDRVLDAAIAPAAVDVDSISRLLYYSVALSAWKQERGPDGRVRSRWSLRVNPSSGNLHPTETYVICGAVPGMADRSGLYHYAPAAHGLELRRALGHELTSGTVYVGLTSIHWREAWKYGERAFRYCQHDIGHAMAAIIIAAASLGWQAALLDSIPTARLSTLLGVHNQRGVEAEHAECLLALRPAGAPNAEPLGELAGSDWLGTPNQLSPSHQHWPVIDLIAAATESAGLAHEAELAPQVALPADRDLPAWPIIRGRRSAVAMDGRTEIGREQFFRMLYRTLPAACPAPLCVLPWRSTVSLVLFVHRVRGMPAGLYILVREPSHEESLRRNFRPEFLWERVEGSPEDLPLWLLVPADVRDAARTASCHQDIAADGAFAAAMLVRFDETLTGDGPAMYPRMFRETGVIGQVLYLEAEASGVKATGIGCFFDDSVHRLLGISGHSWQSLYHFTIGGAVEDPRLESVSAYQHLAAGDR